MGVKANISLDRYGKKLHIQLETIKNLVDSMSTVKLMTKRSKRKYIF